MITRVVAGREVQFDDEGYLADATAWDRELAAAVAAEEGIPELTADHWTVIEWARDRAKDTDWKSPTLRQITTGAGVNTKRLFELFPKGPAKKVARVAGLGKPTGCV
jgi:dissimilatory sulfite reductase related protein